MSKNIDQVFTTNPITTNASTDLMYFGQSPYGVTDDAAMTFANFSAQFGSPFTPAALTESNDTNVTLTLGGTPATALLHAVSITAGWSGTLSLARGGLAAAITASNGGIFYSNATTGALLAGTATAGQLLTSGASTTPAWTTSTYPATNAVNTILYASSANVMSALATADSGVLITSSAGVPSISTTLPIGVQTNITELGTITVGTWTGNNIALNEGGTNASLTASNGGIFYSTAAAGAILSGTATAGLALLSGASTTPSWSNSPPITRVNVQRITTSGAGTYTPTAGMVYVIVRALADGGGGGGAATSTSAQSAVGTGGGGGEYIEALFTSANIGSSKPFSIGAGGAGGAAGNHGGSTGSGTTFNTTWIITSGGVGGNGGAANSTVTSSLSDPGGAGGTGGSVATGTMLRESSGSTGGYAITLSSVPVPGMGGNSGSGGPGADFPISTSSAGFNGLANSGGGGSGAITVDGTQAAGGNGGSGFIEFIEFIST